jgi:hypothetical protein
MNESAEIILCIPGPWKSRAELIQSLVTAHGGRYLFAGLMVLDTQTGDSVEVDLEIHHPGMRAAFHASGLDEDTLDGIGRHAMTAYLHFPLDLPGQRQRMLTWSSVFQQAGGIAIKLETTGISHGWQRWQEWMGSDFIIGHYRAAVILAGGNEGWYSCGMHLFGLADCTTTTGGKDGHSLLDTFNRYLLLEKPALKSGHTFSIEAGAPKYTMHWTADDRFSAADLFYNSHGIWRLEPKSMG